MGVPHHPFQWGFPFIKQPFWGSPMTMEPPIWESPLEMEFFLVGKLISNRWNVLSPNLWNDFLESQHRPIPSLWFLEIVFLESLVGDLGNYTTYFNDNYDNP